MFNVKYMLVKLTAPRHALRHCTMDSVRYPGDK